MCRNTNSLEILENIRQFRTGINNRSYSFVESDLLWRTNQLSKINVSWNLPYGFDIFNHNFSNIKWSSRKFRTESPLNNSEWHFVHISESHDNYSSLNFKILVFVNDTISTQMNLISVFSIREKKNKFSIAFHCFVARPRRTDAYILVQKYEKINQSIEFDNPWFRLFKKKVHESGRERELIKNPKQNVSEIIFHSFDKVISSGMVVRVFLFLCNIHGRLKCSKLALVPDGCYYSNKQTFGKIILFVHRFLFLLMMTIKKNYLHENLKINFKNNCTKFEHNQ